MANWGVQPQLRRGAASLLQDCSPVGMQGPARLDVIFNEKSERLIFCVEFHDFKHYSRRQNTSVGWLQAMGFSSGI